METRANNGRKPTEVALHGRNGETRMLTIQYAQALELATSVFGSQQLAENWLNKPCKYLDGNVPLELIDNSLGFQVVKDYLTRIEHGVYQ